MRLLLITLALVLLAAAAVAGIGQWRGGQLADRLADDSLRGGQAVQTYFQERRARELELISQLLASERPFVAYIAQALALGANGGEVDVASILDLIAQRRNQLGFDVALVISPAGRIVADSRSPLSAPRDLSGLLPVAEAVREVAPARGVWIDGEGAYQVAVVPLLMGPNMEALLLAGLTIDNELARDISRVSGTEVMIIQQQASEHRILAASADLAQARSLLGPLASQVLDSPGAAAQPAVFTLQIEDDAVWRASAAPLAGAPEGVWQVALVPPRQRTDLFSALTGMMGGGAIAAALVILLMPLAISRSVLRPVSVLADGAERAGRGDLPQPIRVSGSGDLQRLGRSFNRVISDLREMRDMESYVAELWQKRSAIENTAPAGPDPGELLPGSLFARRYEIRRKVAEGGMGRVYLALDRELGEEVALKTLRPEWLENPTTLEQLKTEIRTARRITHPNVVRTYDFGQEGDLPFLSMEFVHGVTLRDALRRTGRVRPYAAMRVARQLCAGLGAAHRAGVLHRDIKPSNVMLEVSGTAKLMDFGVSRGIGSPITPEGPERQFAGTPHYLSPEQAQGREAREASDIYSFGILLSELFTGALPIDGDNTLDICMGHLEREPVRPSAYWPEIPPALEALILRCLEKDPARRYPNTDALRDDLERLRA
ncbi:protein kinase domain-containing protein [Pseudomarimonas salicorniae]|nr:protein kinase [Lysobacter sp. CAU 1642]